MLRFKNLSQLTRRCFAGIAAAAITIALVVGCMDESNPGGVAGGGDENSPGGTAVDGREHPDPPAYCKDMPEVEPVKSSFPADLYLPDDFGVALRGNESWWALISGSASTVAEAEEVLRLEVVPSFILNNTEYSIEYVNENNYYYQFKLQYRPSHFQPGDFHSSRIIVFKENVKHGTQIRALDRTSVLELLDLDLYLEYYRTASELSRVLEETADEYIYKYTRKFTVFCGWKPVSYDVEHKEIRVHKVTGETSSPVKGDSNDGSDGEAAINARYIRSGYFYNEHDGWPLPAVVAIVTSRDELEQYYEKHRRSIWDGQGNQRPDENFLNAIEKYTDDYFADNYLVIVGLVEGSGSIRHEVEKIDKNGNIVIKRLLPGMGTADIAAWSIVIERSNSFNVERFQVEVVDVKLYEER